MANGQPVGGVTTNRKRGQTIISRDPTYQGITEQDFNKLSKQDQAAYRNSIVENIHEFAKFNPGVDADHLTSASMFDPSQRETMKVDKANGMADLIGMSGGFGFSHEASKNLYYKTRYKDADKYQFFNQDRSNIEKDNDLKVVTNAANFIDARGNANNALDQINNSISQYANLDTDFFTNNESVSPSINIEALHGQGGGDLNSLKSILDLTSSNGRYGIEVFQDILGSGDDVKNEYATSYGDGDGQRIPGGVGGGAMTLGDYEKKDLHYKNIKGVYSPSVGTRDNSLDFVSSAGRLFQRRGLTIEGSRRNREQSITVQDLPLAAQLHANRNAIMDFYFGDSGGVEKNAHSGTAKTYVKVLPGDKNRLALPNKDLTQSRVGELIANEVSSIEGLNLDRVRISNPQTQEEKAVYDKLSNFFDVAMSGLFHNKGSDQFFLDDAAKYVEGYEKRTKKIADYGIRVEPKSNGRLYISGGNHHLHGFMDIAHDMFSGIEVNGKKVATDGTLARNIVYDYFKKNLNKKSNTKATGGTTKQD